MILGIPTLCRYDLLARLIRSAEASSRPPDGYLIVDNGGSLGAIPAIRRCRVTVVQPPTNMGVSASWNRILEETTHSPVVISNDDVVLAEHTLRDFEEALTRAPFVSSLGMALWGATGECVARLGWLDENFYPAYWEDIDYHHRLALSGMPNLVIPAPERHDQSSTVAALEGEQKRAVEEGFRRGQWYYIEKWGGPQGAETFLTPFDGRPPAGWTERRP